MLCIKENNQLYLILKCLEIHFFMSFDFIYDFVPFDLDKNAKLLIYLPKRRCTILTVEVGNII